MNTTDRRTRRSSSSSAYTCSHCAEAISVRNETVLLRRSDWIPENPSVVVLHRHCVDPFVASYDGSWERFERASVAGTWLLPMETRRQVTRTPGSPRSVPS